MIKLLLETATEVCSVAVARGDDLLAETNASEVHQHASHLTIFIRDTLELAGISLAEVGEVILSDGPGSYTSLRVGAATVKGLCMAMPGLAFATVPTLHALAGAVGPVPAGRILATLNSRRGEVYGQLFSAASGRPETEVLNVRLDNPRWRGELFDGDTPGHVVVCGPGQQRIRERIENDNAFSFAEPVAPAARYLLAPAPRRPDLASYEPLYLNPPFVTKSKKKPLL